MAWWQCRAFIISFTSVLLMIRRRYYHQPFPRNPSFKPPTPLSDNLRTVIYNSYATNPTANDPHTLSIRYGISVRRVEAIIRLKQLEATWKEVIMYSQLVLIAVVSFMMSKTISLEDNHMVKTSIHAWLSDLYYHCCVCFTSDLTNHTRIR